jgi:hypothetical protein
MEWGQGRDHSVKKHFALSLVGSLILLVVSFAANAADYFVSVDYFSLSPDPVTIKKGDAVYWDDNDSFFGPFLITGDWGTISTGQGIRFNVDPGNYGYSAESVYGGGSWSGTVIVVSNSPPSVSITSPTNGAVFTASAEFSFAADATDPNPDDVMDVEFWIDDALVDDVYAAPYTTTVTNLAPGTYTLKAIVWDYSYATATNKITITVVNPPPITLGNCSFAGGKLTFSANGLAIGTTNILQCSTNLKDWNSVFTNVCDGAPVNFTNQAAGPSQFFRLMQLR